MFMYTITKRLCLRTQLPKNHYGYIHNYKKTQKHSRVTYTITMNYAYVIQLQALCMNEDYSGTKY